MSDIFISYKSEKTGVAGALAAALKQDGFDVWWDALLKPGQNYQSQIYDALMAAKVVIVIWSQDSFTSDYVLSEATIALEHKKLVSLRLDDVVLRPPFTVIQTLDFKGWDGDKQGSAYKILRDHLRTRISPSVRDLPLVGRWTMNKLIGQLGSLIHKLKARDSSGRWAYYFVLVPPQLEANFLAAIKGDGIVDLEDYGPVIASNYGESPSQEVLTYLKQIYGFDISG